MSARADVTKARRWREPDTQQRFQLADKWDDLQIRNRSHILIYGKGSAGKAGLGLYFLNRKPRPNHAEIDRSDLFAKGLLDGQPGQETPFEARILVVSFLYQNSYYRKLSQTLRFAPRRPSASKYVADRWLMDVMPLYAGGLTPEDFVAKIDNRMSSAELRGLPYTGVLIDGIHNVFVQFPGLEQDHTSWPQLYSMLRRRGVTVVTTHTEFELHEGSKSAQPIWVDFEYAQKKAAPLLSALVSAADYRFELSAAPTLERDSEYRLTNRGALGQDPLSGYVLWERQECRLGAWQPAIRA